jgi:putative ABC transport system substrate-binding protein
MTLKREDITYHRYISDHTVSRSAKSAGAFRRQNNASRSFGVSGTAPVEEYAKRLALLKEAVPSITRVAVLVASDGRAVMDVARPTMIAAAETPRLELHEVQVETPTHFETTVRKAKDQSAQALYVWPSGFTFLFGPRIAGIALVNRLPSIHSFSESVRAGGLLSYAASQTDIGRRGAVYVDISKHVGRVNRESIVIDAVAA